MNLSAKFSSRHYFSSKPRVLDQLALVSAHYLSLVELPAVFTVTWLLGLTPANDEQCRQEDSEIWH